MRKHRVLSLPTDETAIFKRIPEIAALAAQYGLTELSLSSTTGTQSGGMRIELKPTLDGFLGCPLSAHEIEERLGFIDSFHVAVASDSTAHFAGYCFGYSPSACVNVLECPSTKTWEERELFEHGAHQQHSFGVNFQVAVHPDHVGHGLGTLLAGAVTQEIAVGVPHPCLLWVLLYPFNRVGFRVAQKCGFRLTRTFKPTGKPAYVWGELEYRDTNGY